MQFVTDPSAVVTPTAIIVYTQPCAVCGNQTRVLLDEDERRTYLRWKSGVGYVQTMFPNLSSDEREMLMTGTHPECWKDMMRHTFVPMSQDVLCAVCGELDDHTNHQPKEA